MAQRIEVPGHGVVEFPDGMTDAQIAAAIQRNMTPSVPQQMAKDASGLQALTVGAGRSLDKLAAGLKQGVLGGGAVLSELLPRSYRDRAQDYLARELTDLQTQQKGLDAVYAPLKAERPVLTTIGEALPMMASPMLRPVSGAGAIPAITNAAVSAAAPALVEYGTAEEKAKNAGTAAVTAGGLTTALRSVSKALNPTVSKEAQMLMNEGVTPTPGQIMGGRWAQLEEKTTSAPILGDAIASARQRANEEFNRAVLNRGLSKIGEKTELIGREGVEDAAKKISARYDQLLPTLQAKVDPDFVQDMSKVAEAASELPKEKADQLAAILKNALGKRISSEGVIEGKAIKEAERRLGEKIRSFSPSLDADQQAIADALRDAQGALRGMVMRSNPDKATELSAINSAFANQVRVEGAAGRVGSREGIFTPEALAGAVRAADKSARKNAYAKGNALMQDLSDAGLNVLGRTVPDSGTAGRLSNILAAGSAAINPAPLVGLLGASALYTTPAQKALAAILTQRPELAITAGRGLSQAAPTIGALGGILAANQ